MVGSRTSGDNVRVRFGQHALRWATNDPYNEIEETSGYFNTSLDGVVRC